MKKTSFFGFGLACVLLASSLSYAAPQLSYPAIKKLYLEGELERIRVTLETFLKENAGAAQTNDRIFAYKYLGVIYATEPEGYPVAETYFYRLLRLAPNAHLSDLYVSSAVQGLFEKTQERFRKERRDISEYDEFGNPRDKGGAGKGLADNPGKRDSLGSPNAGRPTEPVPKPRVRPDSKTKSMVWPWVAGGVAITAIGGYIWYANQEKGKKVIPIQGTQ